MSSSEQEKKRHVVMFPFMAKGHTIPLLQLTRLLLRRRRGISVTVLTTEANCPFVSASLAGTRAAVVSLPFPGLAGAESTDALPSMSLFVPFVNATQLMKPHFERVIETLRPRVTLLVSDGFLWWTQDSAAALGIPRLVFYGMSCYAMAVAHDIIVSGALAAASDETSPVTVPSFPWIKVTPGDFEPVLRDPTIDPAHFELMTKCGESTVRSSGMIVNSFREIEHAFADRCSPSKAWCVGPLCLADEDIHKDEKDEAWYLRWLDERGGKNVVYVAFGSQAEISPAQAKEIARGLEESGVDFLWVARRVDGAWFEEFSERVRERGMVVREWADQRRILGHPSVKAFLSHCGWNSVMESVCAGVPILALPLAAEQPLKARMVEEEMKVGVKVVGLLTWQALAKSVKEFMDSDSMKVVSIRANVERAAAAAKTAVEEGGSSWMALEGLMEETSGQRTSDVSVSNSAKS